MAGLPVASSKHGKRPRALTRKERAALRRNVGYVMQHPERQLFADTVAEDVAYGPRNQHLSELEVATRVEEALRMLHIEHLADRSPFNLSGGQQRLVAIAGVIACRPRVLIMDEPTASLDESAVSRIHALLGSLKSQGVAVLIITHSIDEAEHCADRIITIGSHNGDGEGDGCGTGDDEDTSVGDATESSTNAGKAGIESIEDESRNRPSFVASLDPRAKMVTFLTLMFTAFVITRPAQLAMGAVLTACVVAAARLHPLRLLSSVRVFLIVFAVMGLVNMFFARSGETLAHIGPLPITTGGLMVAVLYSCRLALVIILGAVFLATTTPHRDDGCVRLPADAVQKDRLAHAGSGSGDESCAAVPADAQRRDQGDHRRAIGPRRHDRDRFAGHSCQSAVRHHRADPCGGAASRG